MRRFTLNAVLGVLATMSGAAVEPAGAPAARYDLDTVENMHGFVGSEAARELLTRNGFVVTDRQFKQIFEAYIGGSLPKFITTDSAWHTWHVLLEEGVRQLEEIQARRLAAFSRRLMETARASKQSELADFAAIGLALQDDDALAALPKEQMTLATLLRGGAGTVAVPLGFPLCAARFRAASFYDASSALTGYFAARQWYASVVFRLKNDRETILAATLANLIEHDAVLLDLWRQLSEPYDTLLAPAEDGTVPLYAATVNTILGKQASVASITERVADIRSALDIPLGAPMINDQLLTPAQYARFAEEIRGFRLFPPRRLPSAVCFQNTVAPHIEGRMFPSGLDFLVACKTLHSPAARRALEIQDGTTIAAAVAQAECGPLPQSVHGQTLQLLALLQKPPPTGAPAALSSEAWADKQLWTQLAAWAEQRHTWALHSKLTMHYMGMTREPAGMVSPYPEFFEGLGKLARDSTAALAGAGVGQELDVRAVVVDLLAHLERVEKFMDDPAGAMQAATQEDVEIFGRLTQFIMLYVEKRNLKEPLSEAEFLATVDDIKKVAARWADTGQPDAEETACLRAFANPVGEMTSLALEFADLCDRLAAIARRQLAGRKVTEEDEEFIKNYGIQLAKFHFYGGNSWLNPRDDFPLVIPIFVSPQDSRNAILYAGLARPQALYLIADIGGKPHLMRGAVLTYREFRRSLDEPLDDASWTALVQQGGAPPPPAFTSSFLAGITAAEVLVMLKEGKLYQDIDHVPGREITRALVERIAGKDQGDPRRFVTHLCRRATADDVDDLLMLMARASPDHMWLGELALTLAELPWKTQREQLYTMLRSTDAQRADAAAYVLSRQPADIDAALLARSFQAQPVRTKRLYCFLFGVAGCRDDGATEALLAAMADNDPGLRWQAVTAVARTAHAGEATVDTLIARIDDPNDFVAAAAAAALAGLQARRAGPAILARLKKDIRPEYVTNSASSAQMEAISRGTAYSGYAAVMVLNPKDDSSARYRLPSLRAALVTALGELACIEAREHLETMLTGDYVTQAIEALGRIDPRNQTARLLRLALNAGASGSERRHAMEALARMRSDDLAVQLLPLLNETQTVLDMVYGDPAWRTCDQAAETIAALLGWPDRLRSSSTISERNALILKVRQWAADRKTVKPSN